MKRIILTAIAVIALNGCAFLGLNKPKAKVYPDIRIVTTEDAATKKVTDRIIFTDRALTQAIFQERIDRFVNEGGWTVVIPAYLNSLPSETDFGIYIATLERVRPQ